MTEKEQQDRIELLEADNAELKKQLFMKAKRDKEHYAYLPESSLVNFFHYDKCNQKLLAILYWDKMSESQKDVFTDREQMDVEYSIKTRRAEMMSNPTKMKQYFLEHSAPIMDDILAYANGSRKLNGSQDKYYMNEVWEVLKCILNGANTPAPMIDIRGKKVSEQIDEILTSVTEGKITFDDAKNYMSLVSSGFDIQELPKLMATLEAIENK